MVLAIIFLAILLFLINLFSRQIINYLYRLFSLNLLSFFLLPGTVIHELSHMLIAEALFVKTGNFSFTPEATENHLKIGQLQVTKTDFLRRTVIGLAPLLLGITIIGFLSNLYLFPLFSPLSKIAGFDWLQIVLILSSCYLIFLISLTMFSSKKDLEAIIIPLSLLFFVSLTLWLLGFKLTIPQKLVVFLSNLFWQIDYALLLALILNLLTFLFLKTLLLLFKKLSFK